MNADLKWLAENVSEWNARYVAVQKFNGVGWLFGSERDYKHCIGDTCFTRAQWQAARDELENPFSSPDEDEAWLAAEGRMDAIGQNGSTGEHYEKQERYKDDQGEDWIDEAARTFTAEEFRGAMRFTIGKYNRRMGKKDDLISEIEKMRDYCTRWLEVEKGR